MNWLRLKWSRWLVLLAVVPACSKPAEPESALRPVRVMRVYDISEIADRWLPGRARATQELNLAFRVSGPLVELPVVVGSAVVSGDLLARIDPRDFQIASRSAQANLAMSRAQLRAMQVGARPEELEQLRAAVEQAEARLQTASSEYARAERLIETRVISQSEYEQFREAQVLATADLRRAREDLRIGEVGARPEDIEAKEAEIRVLEAGLSTAENQLADTELRAPFDGVIVACFVDNFEQVRAQQPIVRLLDSSRIEMVVNLSESTIAIAPFVRDIECTFDAFPDLRLAAEVSEIGSEASQATRTFPVTLVMDQPEGIRILPGMAGRARGKVVLPDNLPQGLELPESATFERGGQTLAWVIESTDGVTGRAMARQLTLGGISARGLRIVQGVLPGELVATAGVHRLQEGQTVRILETTPREATP